jgi:hypothetical protein
MGQIGLTISITAIVLFTIALLGFSINFANDNDAPISIANDEVMGNLYSDAKTNISQIDEDSNSTYTSIVKSTVEGGSSTFKSAGALEITFSNLLPSFYNVLRASYIRIFGADSDFGVFLLAFISLIGIIAILYILKTFLGGNPD